MDERQLELRVVNLEHRIGVHSENISILMRRQDEHGAKLDKISDTLNQVKWIFVGFCLFFAAGEVGISAALGRLLGV